jgi:hypothetical protein
VRLEGADNVRMAILEFLAARLAVTALVARPLATTS